MEILNINGENKKVFGKRVIVIQKVLLYIVIYGIEGSLLKVRPRVYLIEIWKQKVFVYFTSDYNNFNNNGFFENLPGNDEICKLGGKQI